MLPFAGRWCHRHSIGTLATRNVASNEVKTSFHNMDTVEGLAEGVFYNVDNIPTTLVGKNGKEIKRWEQEVPSSGDVEALIK